MPLNRLHLPQQTVAVVAQGLIARAEPILGAVTGSTVYLSEPIGDKARRSPVRHRKLASMLKCHYGKDVEVLVK